MNEDFKEEIKKEIREEEGAAPAAGGDFLSGEFWQKLFRKGKAAINKMPAFSPRNIIIASAIVIALAGFIYAVAAGKIFKRAEKKMYDVAVVVRSQENSDPAEDKRSSLKAGDVLLTQLGAHGWSATEAISYLILKMNLTADEAVKLTAPKTRTLSNSDLSKAEQDRIKADKERAKKDGRKYSAPPRTETLLARQYYIDLAKIDFTDPNVLMSGQPYSNKVFDWGIVRKK